jgi:hypothetical protein
MLRRIWRYTHSQSALAAIIYRLFSFCDVLNELETYCAVTNLALDKLGCLRVQTNVARHEDGVAVLDS